MVSVVRHNKSLEKGNFHMAAEAGNFFLRGFNYLFIARKPVPVARPERTERGGHERRERGGRPGRRR